MLRHWYIYSKADGLFTGQRVSYPPSDTIEDFVASTVATGYSAIEGIFDYLSQKVDVTSGAVVDYQPPPPDADHEWIHNDANGNRVRRWVLKADVNERRNRRDAILAELDALDAKLVRPLAEISEYSLHDTPTDEERIVFVAASFKVQGINERKRELRDELVRIANAR